MELINLLGLITLTVFHIIFIKLLLLPLPPPLPLPDYSYLELSLPQFLIQALPWPESMAAGLAPLYARLVLTVCSVWGQAECQTTLSHLPNLLFLRTQSDELPNSSVSL